jgi:dethiobiotin synthetase
MNWPGTPGLFITGTDTGAGKTHVSVALLNALRAQGVRAVAMKPVASGAVVTAEGLRNADAERLRTAASVDLPYSLVNPYCFEPPTAPQLAAAEAGVQISIVDIVQTARAVARGADYLIVEGIGGWRVPLFSHRYVSDLAAELELPVLLVVGLRLGCINHAVLAAEAIRRDAIPFAGWVATAVQSDFSRREATLENLSNELGIAPLAVFEWDPSVASAATLEAARRVLASVRSKSQ